MGFHLILNPSSDNIEHVYVESFEDLANYAVKENSIIYKGEKHWTPMTIINSKEYCKLSKPRFRAAVKAEQKFKEQANKKGFIIETLNQDQKSFKNYVDYTKDFVKLKRGDFLIRNLKNYEIEVKCKTMYYYNDQKVRLGPHFYLEKEHIEKHKNMQRLTMTPIIFAIYQRHKSKSKEDHILEDKLYMISLKEVENIIKRYNLQPVYRDYGDAYTISIKACQKNFKLLLDEKRNFERKLTDI